MGVLMVAARTRTRWTIVVLFVSSMILRPSALVYTRSARPDASNCSGSLYASGLAARPLPPAQRLLDGPAAPEVDASPSVLSVCRDPMQPEGGWSCEYAYAAVSSSAASSEYPSSRRAVRASQSALMSESLWDCSGSCLTPA